MISLMKETVAKWVFGSLVVLTIVGLIANKTIGTWGPYFCDWVGSLCHDVPYLIGFGVLLLLWALYRFLAGDWNALETIRGADKRWSTSKCQFFLWTVVALFSYASLYAARIGAGLLTTQGFDIPTNLLLAMGLSVTTAVAAKGITVSQLSNQTATKEHIDPEDAQAGDLIKDDSGAIDLTKVQMLGWTIIALGAYIASVAHTVQHIGPNAKLPDIDTALMVLMGLGQGAYLAKKIIVNTTPAITGVKPSTARPGTDITLSGSALGATQGQSMIILDGVPIAFPGRTWSDTTITFTLTNPSLTPGQKALGVTVGTQNSNSVTLTVLRSPTITNLALSVDGKTLTLTGSGFGPQQNDGDLVKINDKPSGRIISWNDTTIAFENPDLAIIKSGATISIKLFLDGDSATPAASRAGFTL